MDQDVNVRRAVFAIDSYGELEGPFFAAVPLDRRTLEGLKAKIAGFRRVLEGDLLPDQMAWFACGPEWFEVRDPDGDHAGDYQDDPEGCGRMSKLDVDFILDEEPGNRLPEAGAACDDEDEFVVLGDEILPLKGNVSTEADRLVLIANRLPAGGAEIEVRWRAYVKHTSVELETPAVTEAMIDAWLAETPA